MSAKIRINFVSSTPINPHMNQNCIKKDLGYHFDDHFIFKICKTANNRTFAPFLIVERKKHFPDFRISFQLQFVDLETKQEYTICDAGRLYKKKIYFKLKYRKLFFAGSTLSIKGELEIHPTPSKEILPASQTTIPLSTLSDDFTKLFCSRTFSDVMIRCGAETFPAHKNILTVRCPYFAGILMNSPEDTQLDVHDLDPDVFRAVLFYIYSGKTQQLTTIQDACPLLDAANKYQLSDLKMLCADFIKLSITLENVFDIYYEFEAAQFYASEFIAKNIKYIEYSEQWKIFKHEKPDVARGLLSLLPK